MNKKVKAKWIKALRSGVFTQIQGQLCSDQGYCALGVLSVLALLEGVCTYNETPEGGVFDGRSTQLSYNVRAWAEIPDMLEDEAGLLPVLINGKKTSIAFLNDEGVSFKELARLIEVHL